MSKVDQWRGSTGVGDIRGLSGDPSTSHVTLTDPQTEQELHALLITGLLSHEGYLNPLAARLRRNGATTHNVQHKTRANLVVGMRKQVEERADELAQRTGEPINLIGYSLGGYYAARLHQEQPELVRRTVTIAAPVSPVFGIMIPPDEDAVSIASPLDTVVPFALTLNPTFSGHRLAPFSSHMTIVFNKAVANMVSEEISRPSTVKQAGELPKKRELIEVRRSARERIVFAA